MSGPKDICSKIVNFCCKETGLLLIWGRVLSAVNLDDSRAFTTLNMAVGIRDLKAFKFEVTILRSGSGESFKES